MGSGGIAPLDEVTGELHAPVALLPEKDTPFSI
jgi:hypothetical protein